MRARGTIAAIAFSVVCGACAADDAAAVDGVLRTQVGPFEGTLVVEPNPPHVGEHRVVLTLDRLVSSAESDAGEESDASEELSAPVANANVVISPFMPAHGHGSADVEAVEEDEGLYAAEHVRFTMPGIWELRVHVVQGELEGDLIATVEVP